MQENAKYVSKCKSTQGNQENPGKMNLKQNFISHIYNENKINSCKYILMKDAETYLHKFVLALGPIPIFYPIMCFMNAKTNSYEYVTVPLGLWMFERPGELWLNHSNVNFKTVY